MHEVIWPYGIPSRKAADAMTDSLDSSGELVIIARPLQAQLKVHSRTPRRRLTEKNRQDYTPYSKYRQMSNKHSELGIKSTLNQNDSLDSYAKMLMRDPAHWQQ